MIDEIVAEVLPLLGTGRQIAPFSSRHPGFGLTEAYVVAAQVTQMRIERGERPVGRKIGFTNQAVWNSYGIAAPIWGTMYDSTVQELDAADTTFSLKGLAEPRIEPEIVLRLAAPPQAGMTEVELLGCIDWVAHGIEIVHSIYPGWRFTAADAVAAFGVHGALLVGARHPVARGAHDWLRPLSSFTVSLTNGDARSVSGHARSVLGGPLKALSHLVEELERSPGSPPLATGEIITTGTLTEAMPAVSGESWTTAFDVAGLKGLRLELR